MADLPLAAEFPAATEAQWRAAVDKALKGADFERKLVSHTADRIAIQALYPKADGAVIAKAALGPWRVMQRIDVPAPDMANELALADLEGGADALALVFAGASTARGFGLSIETVGDLERALENVRLEYIALRVETAPWQGRVIAAILAALIERARLAPQTLDIDFGLDPIGDFTTTGRTPASFAAMFARIHEVASTLRARGYERASFIRVDARRLHEAGASEAQELAYALAAGVAYLRALETHGVAPDAARRMLSFLMAADQDQFLTIAKFRALRKLWARVEDTCGLAPEPIRLAAETAWRMTTKRDPNANMLRATIAAFSAGLGGADSVTALPFTAALGAPDAFARRIARNMQLILIEESNLARVVDPAAGAGGFEALTNELCDKAWALFQEIERNGGIVQSLIDGKLQARIVAIRAAREKAVAKRREPITGTSDFPNLSETTPAILAIDPPAPREKKGGRLPGDRIDFSGTIEKFRDGLARGLMSAAPQDGLSCEPLPSQRLAEPFEKLRDHSDTLLTRDGHRPRVFLANLGPLASFTARAMFAKNFFEAGGIEAIANDGFTDNGETGLIELTDAFKASGAKLACICGSDDTYHREAADAALALGASGAVAIYLAGHPTDIEGKLRAAGVTNFIYLGCDAVAALADAQSVVE